MGLKLFPLALVLGATVLLATPSAQTSGELERYSASAINTNNGTVNNVDITVNRWSTDRERDALIATIADKGADKLLDVLQGMQPVGHFGAPRNLSWDLRLRDGLRSLTEASVWSSRQTARSASGKRAGSRARPPIPLR